MGTQRKKTAAEPELDDDQTSAINVSSESSTESTHGQTRLNKHMVPQTLG